MAISNRVVVTSFSTDRHRGDFQFNSVKSPILFVYPDPLPMLYRRARQSRTTIQCIATKATGRGFGSSNLQANCSETVSIYQIATYRSVTPANIALIEAGSGLTAQELLSMLVLTGWLWTQVAIDFFSNKLAVWNPQLVRVASLLGNR